MASPFSLFRKYLKPMMVVLCGMAILAFVVLDPLMQYMGTTGGGGGAYGRDGSKVVVTWKDGQLTEAEINQLVYRRNLLARFQAAIFQQGLNAAYLEGTENLSMSVQPLELPIDQSQGVEQHVVQTQLIADLARKQGMAVSDQAIKDFFDKVGRNRVTFDQMNAMLEQISNRRPMAAQIVFDAARDELLRQNFLASYNYTVRTTLPEQWWSDWLQLNDRIVVEAAGLKTSDFLDQVKEPTDEQVRELYEQYKNNVVRIDPSTELPVSTPGFMVPQKIRFQYLEANYDAVLQEMMAKVTDQEIATFYEENKDLFIRADSGSAVPAPESDAPLDDAERDLFGIPKDLNPEAEKEAPESTEEKPAETPETPTEPPMEEEEAVEETPETPVEQPESPNDEQSRRYLTESPFRLASYQEAESTEAESTEEEPSEEASGEEDASEAQPATDDAPAVSPTTENEPAEASETAEPASEEQLAETAETEAPAVDKPNLKVTEYEPLEEVKEQIRRAIANQKVAAEMRTRMRELYAQLDEAYLPFFDSRMAARHDKKPEPTPPAELSNLQPLAESNGLQFHDTGEVSIWDFRETDLAMSVEVLGDDQDGEPLINLIVTRLKTYEPVLTRERLTGNFYLGVLTSNEPGYVPSLEEARDEVVQAWKRQEASKLALEEAERLAKEIQSKDLTFGDKFANDPNVEIVVTDPFTWLTTGVASPTSMEVPIRLGDPQPVVAAGFDFMKTVFDLKEGEVGAVLNNDHSIAYVVRVQEHLENRETLQQQFLADMSSGRWFAGGTMQRAHVQAAIRTLISGLFQELDVDWKRLPDTSRSEQEEET